MEATASPSNEPPSLPRKEGLPTYDPQKIEASVQKDWQERDLYRAVENDPRFPKGKFYACSMLPYPSGKLHMGHVRNYTINDVIYRHRRMQGYNVLMPMGWDAFGLPAENAAMQQQRAPAQWTLENIAHMKRQMQSMGLSIDWHREIATCDPSYYRWTQWLFLRMLERGIAYVKTGTVNWDPVDQTVLANEQVIDGRGWRSGALVEKREIPMYYLAISQYSDALLEGLATLDWPDRVVAMQENWIGRSTGVRLAFPHTICNAQGDLIQDGKLFVFTTRADTLMGVTFVAIAPEHPIAVAQAARDSGLAGFIQSTCQGGVSEAAIASREKEGYPTGLYVQHPLTGEHIPVWVANYVLMSYGDGAVMGVPGHDERDFAFAHRFQVPIKQVLQSPKHTFDQTRWQDWYTDKTSTRCVHSGPYDGLPHVEAVKCIADDLEKKGLGSRKVQYRLRDWGISRQRYWGTPIPIIHCAKCGPQPVPDADLPVVLPDHLIPDGTGNPLAHCENFLRAKCPRCGSDARRETDTMDTFVDSSWYFMRYCCPDNDQCMVDQRSDYWMPMDQYIGGIEHAVLHLLYARFWTQVMAETPSPLLPGQQLSISKEPFKNLLCQGMVLNQIFFRKEANGGSTYFSPEDVRKDPSSESWQLKTDGAPVEYAGIGTMSKSKKNGVDPQVLIEKYGADAARLFVLFTAPPEQTMEWSGTGIDGAQRFLKRLWRFCNAYWAQENRIHTATAPENTIAVSPKARALLHEIHTLLKQADYDYQRRQYNTVVSAAMKMLNTLESAISQTDNAYAITESLGILLRVLYPVVPHITQVLWQTGGYAAHLGDIVDAPWPEVSQQWLERDMVELSLQINGKFRGTLHVPAQADQSLVEQLVMQHEAYARHASGRPIRKVVFVPNRLINVVLG